jgi:hypothetical protein
MVVTFDSGLETLGERLASKRQQKQGQTLWKQYVQKERWAALKLLL